MAEERQRFYRVPSAWGEWRVVFTDNGLRGLTFPAAFPSSALKTTGRSRPAEKRPRLPVLGGREGRRGRLFSEALRARVLGRRTDLPWDFFDLRGASTFKLRVLRAMYEIPFGETRTYGELAVAAGRPGAARAAGNVCGSNPLPLFIPCHRVIGAAGPGGFGPGLEWKRLLLRTEGVAV